MQGRKGWVAIGRGRRSSSSTVLAFGGHSRKGCRREGRREECCVCLYRPGAGSPGAKHARAGEPLHRGCAAAVLSGLIACPLPACCACCAAGLGAASHSSNTSSSSRTVSTAVKLGAPGCAAAAPVAAVAAAAAGCSVQRDIFIPSSWMRVGGPLGGPLGGPTHHFSTRPPTHPPATGVHISDYAARTFAGVAHATHLRRANYFYYNCLTGGSWLAGCRCGNTVALVASHAVQLLPAHPPILLLLSLQAPLHATTAPPTSPPRASRR